MTILDAVKAAGVGGTIRLDGHLADDYWTVAPDGALLPNNAYLSSPWDLAKNTWIAETRPMDWAEACEAILNGQTVGRCSQYLSGLRMLNIPCDKIKTTNGNESVCRADITAVDWRVVETDA